MALKVLRPKGGHKKNKERPSGAQQNQRANRMILRRTLFLMVLCGIVAFIPLIATLYKLMIVEHDHYEALAINNQTRSTRLTAARGEIYDRNMNILAASTTVETVFIDPNEIAKEMEKPENSGLLDTIANGLSNILGVEPDFVRMQAADTKYRYKAIERKISEELADEVRTFINDNKIKGVYLETDAKRYYPYSSLGAQLLGFVSDDNIGTEGLEAYYNSYLEGVAGKVVTTKGNYGSEMPYTFEKYYDATNGDSLVLTIDTTVQSYLEKNLQAAIDRYEIQNGAFGIVMDVNTGAVLAMASLPTYDLNSPGTVYNDFLTSGMTEEQVLENMRDLLNKQWRSKAINDTYEPGSVAKSITIAGALEEKSITPNTTFDCQGYIELNDGIHTWRIRCHNRNGDGVLDATMGLAKSCNVYLMNTAFNEGAENFVKYQHIFGFGEYTGIDLPAEADTTDLVYNAENMGRTALATNSFGQNFNVTMIQMAAAYCSIINGGSYYKPHVVKQILNGNGTVIEDVKPELLRTTCSKSTSDFLKQALYTTVEEGTGKKAKIQGYHVGGKTGTAEKLPRSAKNYLVSFCGFAPVEDPQLLVYVIVDTPNLVGEAQATASFAVNIEREIMNDALQFLNIAPSGDTDPEDSINAQLQQNPEGISSETMGAQVGGENGAESETTADETSTETDADGNVITPTTAATVTDEYIEPAGDDASFALPEAVPGESSEGETETSAEN